MTVEQIDAQISKLKEQKKARLQKQRALENAKKRKVENRVKYILGGLELAKIENDKTAIETLLKNPKLREQDLETLKKYFGFEDGEKPDCNQNFNPKDNG